jgi:cytochrome c oxidase subunit 3
MARSITTTVRNTRKMTYAVTPRDDGGAGGVGQSTALMPHGVFGMLLFVIAEAMLFAGLFSAIEIVKTSAMVWPPPGQPRLPIAATVFNTAVLLASGGFLVQAHRAFHRGERGRMRTPMWTALALGTFFVVFQGFEWVRMIHQGLTMTSSSLGSFFYLIVGLHALHAMGAIGLLAYACVRLQRGWLTDSLFGATEVLWFFVVGVWPILFAFVYR